MTPALKQALIRMGLLMELSGPAHLNVVRELNVTIYEWALKIVVTNIT